MKRFNNFNIDYVGKKKIFFIIALVLVAVSIVSFVVRGFNLDTDFVGGTTFEYSLDRKATNDDLNTLKSIIENNSEIKVSSTQISGDNTIIAKAGELKAEDHYAIDDKVFEEFGIDENAANFSNIGASISGERTRSLIVAVCIAIALMLVYITIRFKFSTGIAAIICLAHDVTIVLGFYALFQIPFNSNVIACLLTILGYSINATIIVFDRVRENEKLFAKNTYSENVNRSINQTLTRSINTTITTLLTVIMILIFAVSSIRQFAMPLIVGMVAGLFSSICLAGNISVLFNKKK